MVCLMLEMLLDKNNIGKVLLIDPDFPRATKSRNHKDLLPVGLLKIGAYLKSRGIETRLIRLPFEENHESTLVNFNPDLVLITSVFTYWADEVKSAVEFSKRIFPQTDVVVGGIFASLLPDVCKDFTNCDYIHQGTVKCAECLPPDYSLLENNGDDIDFQIVHSSRGCNRRCKYCGVYKIEPNFNYKTSIEKELIRKNLVFYDNNLLNNPDIETLLCELIRLRKEKKITKCESQSGFDGRLLHKNEYLAKLLKEANFKNPKLAWDGPYKTYKRREEEISILERGGFKRKEISVFMLYNHDLSYDELEKKRAKCFKLGVQVSDCRFRPLDRLSDGYNSYKKSQTNDEYYIHDGWTDEQVRQFRRNVRRHNICIRHNMKYHSRLAEIKKISKDDSMIIRNMTADEAMATGIIDDAWDPAKPFKL